MSQLSLLDWIPPRQVIAFPLAHRVGKVRHVADILSAKQGNAAVSYWRQTVTTIAGQMNRSGLSADVVDAELRSFHDAVQRELWRRNGQDRRPGGDAA